MAEFKGFRISSHMGLGFTLLEDQRIFMEGST